MPLLKGYKYFAEYQIVAHKFKRKYQATSIIFSQLGMHSYEASKNQT